MSVFKSELFNLSKKIIEDSSLDSIRNTIKSLVLFNDASVKFDNKKEIASNGLRLCCGFNGILLAFENRLSISKSSENVDLTEDEYYQLSFGNFIINSFIDLCLVDISYENPLIAKVLHPYSFYKKIKENSYEFKFDESILQPAVKAFKSTKIYCDITTSGLLQTLKKVPEIDIFRLFQVLEHDLINIPMDKVPKEIFDISMKKRLGISDANIDLSFVSFKLLALREMLKNACRLIYSAIIGNKLIVFDENCLIDIKHNAHNFIYNYKTIVIQGIPILFCDELIGNIILFDLKNNAVNEHQFGIARSITMNYSRDEGETTTISFCEIDDEMNPIFTLTN